MHDKRICDAIETRNHNEGTIQDVSHEPAVEDNGTFSKQMSEAGHQSSSSSKKLKSFHLKDGKAVEHTMQHGNASTGVQQEAATNSEFNFGVEQSQASTHSMGLQLDETSLLVIEACAGTATLSSVLKDVGFEVLPIDFGKQRNSSHLHIINLDLRKRHSWDFLAKIAMSRRMFHIHGAPPCGTASKAREIPMGEGHHGPPQLRSEQYPLGFPWLQGVNKDRVQSANAIYVNMALFCLWLHSKSIGWSVENPGNSYIWMIDMFIQLQQFGFWVFFHACCHGSTRKKLTAFLTSVVELTGLEATCQGDHPHESWGLIRDCEAWSFATSKEAAYPVQLCQRFGTLLEMKALRLGLRIFKMPISALRKVRASVGSQPKISKFPTLIPEFLETRSVVSQSEPVLNDKRQLERVFHNIPLGAKMLRSSTTKGEECEQQQKQKYIFGIYRSSTQFVQEALSLQHPFDSCIGVPDDILKRLSEHLSSSPLDIMRKRLTTLQRWRKKAFELKTEDEALFENMTSGCRSVLRGKSISLMRYIAKELNWPDKTLFDELVQGFKLTGVQPRSGIFESDCKPPQYDEDELMARGKFVRPALWGKIQAEPLQEFSAPLSEITLAEAQEKGWLKGPLTFNDINLLYQGDWLPVRRFAVFQKDKWRPIDDFSENGVNGSFGSLEKVDLRALDETVWISVAMMRAIKSGTFSFKLSDGSELAGHVHKDWFQGGIQPRPMIKTLDLKSAYKQLALNELESRKSVICLKCPDDGQVYGFACKTLPFGAVASVLHFNRFARFLRAVFLECGVVACNYFDDYPIVELSNLTSNTSGTLRAIAKFLGVQVAEDKDVDFSMTTDLLGVTVDLSDELLDEVRVCNKLERKKDLSKALGEIIHSRRINPMQIPSLFGRLQFAESQILGRAGGLALKFLRKLENMNVRSVELEDEQVQMFSFLQKRLNHSKPRCITTSSETLPTLVFTDGAYEPGGDSEGLVGTASIGGVIYYHDGLQYHCRAFGCILPRSLVEKWAKTGKRHLIGQTELYAVVIARLVWSNYIDNKRCIFFIDHGGVMSACIKGNAKDLSWRTLLLKMEEHDELAPVIGWFTRVPSASNIADGPSRGKFDELKHFIRDHPVCMITSEHMLGSENLL